MKTLTSLIFSLLLISITAEKAVASETLLQEGKVWNYVLHYVTQDFQFMTCESQTWIDGDTIIDGRPCYRVCTTDCYESGAEQSVRYMYEEDGRVYQMASHSAIILYDFSLDETTGLTDDILHSGWCPEDCQVSKTDTVFVKGHYRKRIHFSWADWCWVEGIGSTANLNQPFGNPVSDGKRYEFVSCYMDGACLFEKDDFNAPGVTDGIQNSYLPMLQDGKKWVTTIGTYSYTHYIEGDTLIGGNTWKKVYANNYDQPVFSYYGAIRQEGEMVYGIAAEQDEPLLLYDFGLNVGDILYWVEKQLPGGKPKIYYISKSAVLGVGHKITVEDIDTIQVNGQELRRITLKSMYIIKAPPTSSGSATAFNPYYVWVEGIGCEGGLFVSGRKIMDDCELYCMMNDSVIFEYEDFHLPGVTDGIQKYEQAVSQGGEIFDLQGRRLQAAPAKGLYIRDGKKYLVR